MHNFLQLLRNKYIFHASIYYNELGRFESKKNYDKFKGALGSYAKLDTDEIPLVLFDSTFFGSAKDGFILTTKGIHIHGSYSSEKHAPFIAYKDLRVSQLEKDLIINGSEFSMIPLSVKEVTQVLEIVNLCKDKFTDSNSSKSDDIVTRILENATKKSIERMNQQYTQAVTHEINRERQISVNIYGHEFSINESGICEARGKYLVLESIKKVPDLVKRQVLSYRSVDELTRKIPKLAGFIYLKTIQHLLYILKREGVTNFNGKNFFECVFKITHGSAVQILCRDYLKSMSFRSDKDKIVKYTLSAINFDLGNMWRGYVFAHGYDPNAEQFSSKKFNEMNITKELSDKNLPIDRVAELMVKILQYAPDWIEAYKVIEKRLGKNLTLKTYKKWFVEDFKAGSYHDISDGSMSKTQARNKLNAILGKSKNNFESDVYFCGDDEKSDAKIELAISHYADIQYGEIPLLCYDATVFGDASDGLLVTTNGIYAHNISKKPIYFDYSQISSIEVKGFITSSLYINNFKVDTSGKDKTFRKNLREILLLIKQAFE